MGSTSSVIMKVLTPELHKVIIETTDGHRYHSDLSNLSKVYCYPVSEREWGQVSIDSYGLGLIWVTRFEVHIDQIIGLADKIEVTDKAS